MDYIEIIEKSIYNIDSKICGIIDDYKVLQDSQKVKIYMSKETQNKPAEKFVKSNVGLQQAQLFAGHAGLKLKNKLSS